MTEEQQQGRVRNRLSGVYDLGSGVTARIQENTEGGPHLTLVAEADCDLGLPPQQIVLSGLESLRALDQLARACRGWLIPPSSDSPNIYRSSADDEIAGKPTSIPLTNRPGFSKI